jgi:UPF0716 protein FxsA
MRFVIGLLPWLELLTLIQLGIETSALTALAYVLLTFVLGLVVLRHQGMELFTKLRETQQGRIFGQQLFVDEMAVGLAGILLLIPGLISDFAAVIVLIGPLRRRLARWFLGPQPEPYRPESDRDPHVTIDGDFSRVKSPDDT